MLSAKVQLTGWQAWWRALASFLSSSRRWWPRWPMLSRTRRTSVGVRVRNFSFWKAFRSKYFLYLLSTTAVVILNDTLCFSLHLFYKSLQCRKCGLFVTKPLIVYSVLKLVCLHCGRRKLFGPRQYVCTPASCFQRQVLLLGGLLPLEAVHTQLV